jgi:hypothetical protein
VLRVQTVSLPGSVAAGRSQATGRKGGWPWQLSKSFDGRVAESTVVDCGTVKASLEDGFEATTGRSGVDVREAAHTGNLMVAQPESALRRLDKDQRQNAD